MRREEKGVCIEINIGPSLPTKILMGVDTWEFFNDTAQKGFNT